MLNHGWSLTKKERRAIEALGEAWLGQGAAGFGFRVDNRVVYSTQSKQPAKVLNGNGTSINGNGNGHYPDPLIKTNSISAQVTLHEKQSGTLFVDGLSGAVYQKRLDLDASFLTDSAKTQDDINALSMELVEKQDQLVTLYQLSQIMRRHLEIQPLFSSLIRTLQALFHTEALITLVSSGGLSPIVSAYPNNSWLDGNTIRSLQDMHTQGKSVIFNTTELKNIRNLLFLPLDVKDPFQASFVFANKLAGNFKTTDLKLAQVIGEQISAQFEYVQLHQEVLAKARLQAEADMARNVQMQLLPTTPPEIDGLDLFAQSKPASQVGGDFYLFVPDAALPLFILGDVSGKGMPAALLMTMLRSSFQNAARSSTNPDSIATDVLGDASQSMYGDFTAVEMFATSIVVAYDPSTRQLSYSNAGHSPVIYCPAGGEPIILPANGPAMGIIPTIVAEQDSIFLTPGDLFIICTDGFNEAWNGKEEMYGYDRLLKLVSSLRGYSAMEIAVEMYMAIDAFTEGHEQDDDQTLIVIKGVDHGSE